MKIYNEVDFNNKINELQNAAGNKNVWIRDDLSVRKKSNRFVRILSLLLSMIGIDCYRHYRVHNVAKEVFLFAQTNQEHLTVDNTKLLMKTLDWMKQRTGKKYENTVEIIKSAIYGILYNKGLTKPADDPVAAPANAAAQPAQTPPPLLPRPVTPPANAAAQPAQTPPPLLPRPVTPPADAAAQPAQTPPPPLPPRRPLPPIPVDADGLNAARGNLRTAEAPEPQPQALTAAQLQAHQLRPAAARQLPPAPAEKDPVGILTGALDNKDHLLPTGSIVMDNPYTADANDEPDAFATYTPEELERALQQAELRIKQEEERRAREAELIEANRREFAARGTQSEPNLHIVRAATRQTDPQLPQHVVRANERIVRPGTPVDLNNGLDGIVDALQRAASPQQQPSPEPVSPTFAADAITGRRAAFDSIIDYDGGWSTVDALPLPQVSDSDDDHSVVHGAVDDLPFPDSEN